MLVERVVSWSRRETLLPQWHLAACSSQRWFLAGTSIWMCRLLPGVWHTADCALFLLWCCWGRDGTPQAPPQDEDGSWWRHKCKLSESPKKLTLRPLWRHLWRHLFKNFENSKIHQNYIYEPICIIPVANERYWMIQQYYIAYLLFLCPWRHTMTSSNH